ncbi:MAG: condensation domain-containing protein, partial [Cyanobacteria bacterium J06621_8]
MKPNNVEDIYPVTPVQNGMLFHCLYDSELSLYFFQHIHTLKGTINVELFEKAWQLIVDRHAILRTGFYWEDVETPLQIVYSQVKAPFCFYDWSDLNSVTQQQQHEAFLVGDRQKSFDFSQPCLMRNTLIRTADDIYQYIWSFNHIVMDGWGGSLLMQEFSEVYDKLYNQQKISFTPTRPFRDYIDWLEEQDMSKAESFWQKALKGIKIPTSLNYIANNESTEQSSNQEVRYDEEIIKLSLETTKELNSFATQYRLTQATIINGIWAILLSRYSCCNNVLYGCTVTGRPADLEGVESMAGMFVNTLPIHVQVNQEESLISWMQRFQLQLVETRNYEFTPLVKAHQWSEIPPGLTLFDSLVVLENFPVSEIIKNYRQDLEFQHSEIYYRNNYP